MTDRELLEMAAKAAGLTLYWSNMLDDWQKDLTDPYVDKKPWNPLTDDGDALRLATRLCMSVSTGPCEASANTIAGALRGAFFKEETIQQDHDKATRRAIVRAAAEIGKAMP